MNKAKDRLKLKIPWIYSKLRVRSIDRIPE